MLSLLYNKKMAFFLLFFKILYYLCFTKKDQCIIIIGKKVLKNENRRNHGKGKQIGTNFY